MQMLVLQEKRFGHDRPSWAGRRMLTPGRLSKRTQQHAPELA